MDREVARRRYETKCRFGFLLLWFRETFVCWRRQKMRDWENRHGGLQGGKIHSPGRRTSLEQKEGLFLHQPRSEVKLANEATIHILLGQPRAHSTHAVRQGKVFRNVLFKNISWARFEIFLPKKSLPSSPRCHKRERSIRDTQSISTTSNSYWPQEDEKGVICNTQVLSHLHSPITSLLWTDLFCLAKQIPMTKKKMGW